jgi:hypothetical protein
MLLLLAVERIEMLFSNFSVGTGEDAESKTLKTLPDIPRTLAPGSFGRGAREC